MRHLLRGARGNPEHLAGVVADAGVTELQHPVARAQRSEPLAKGDVERTAASRNPGEERIEEPRHFEAHGFVPLARQPPRQQRGCMRERVQPDVEGVGIVRDAFHHEMILSVPSDIRTRPIADR